MTLNMVQGINVPWTLYHLVGTAGKGLSEKGRKS
jgi:hypothetical protein